MADTEGMDADTEGMSASTNTEVITADEEQINMIMRQTNYTRELVLVKLVEYKKDSMKIIREYMGAGANKNEPTENKKSVNQQIYKEIRGMMDEAARTYETNKK